VRTPMKAHRIRIPIATACVLLSGSALAATTAAPAQAAPLAAHKITVTNPGTQTTNPLSAHVDLAIKAADSDKSAALTYTATGLPLGLAISKTTGVISGTITTADADATVKVTATDSTKVTGSASFTWSAKNTIVIANPGAQTTTAGNPVSVAVPAADDDKAATLTWTAADLPTGLSINAVTGIITGIPTVNGTYSATVKVTDKTKSAAAVTFTWKVTDLVRVSAPGSERSTISVPISPVAVTATDTAAGQTFTYSAAALPPGLAINAKTGVISGTPTGKAAFYTVTVTAKDAAGAAGSAPIGWRIGNLVTVRGPAAEQSWMGIAVSVAIKATDSAPGQLITYSATGLPAGLSINPKTGVISGTPTKITNGTATVTATDAAGSFGTATVTWKVGEPISFPDRARVPITAGVTLTLAVSADDALPRDHLTLSVRGLPAGLTFQASTTRIFGWVALAGSYPVTVIAKGSLGDSSSMRFTLAVGSATGGGPTGQIRLNLGGKCLADVANKAALWTCAPGSPQQWAMATDGSIRARGACLDVEGSVGYLGQGIRMWHCAGGSPRETWAVGSAGQLVNPASGLCLGDAKGSTANGYRPTLVTCRVTSTQVWALPTVQLRSARATECADDLHDGGANGNVIDMFTCNGTGSQAWALAPDFTVRMFGGDCLTDPSTLGRVNAKIDLGPCVKGDRGQKVVVVRQSPLGSWLTISGVCVAVPGLTAPDTTQLITATCSAANPLDLWHIW
jgi:hypothetical protein